MAKETLYVATVPALRHVNIRKVWFALRPAEAAEHIPEGGAELFTAGGINEDIEEGVDDNWCGGYSDDSCTNLTVLVTQAVDVERDDERDPADREDTCDEENYS